MKIIFMGTPEFAVPSLERLYNDGHDVTAVFTGVDKPRNRGMKTSFSPVKELAISRGTPIYQPETFKDGKAVDMIKELQCDLICVVAYGKILPTGLLDIPPLGCINIHGSLLPKYRGASPIQYAILNGEKETGVTSMYITEGEVDSGDILLSKKTSIGDDETSADLFKRLSILGAELLGETVVAIENNTVVRIPQDPAEVTYAPLLTKNMSPVDFTKSAYDIKCKVRGLYPWPVATMLFGEDKIKVFAVDTTDSITGKNPGEIVSSGQSGIEIACCDGTVIIKELQAPGGKRMTAADFLLGYRG